MPHLERKLNSSEDFLPSPTQVSACFCCLSDSLRFSDSHVNSFRHHRRLTSLIFRFPRRRLQLLSKMNEMMRKIATAERESRKSPGLLKEQWDLMIQR